MPFVPVSDTLAIELVYEYAGQTVENTSYVHSTPGWTIESISTFLDELRVLVQEELMPLLSTTIALVRLVGTLLDAVDAASVTLTVSPPFPGSTGGANLPNNSAYVVTFLTAGRGRSKRGRNYIAGLTVNDEADPNRVNTTFRTGLLAFYDAYLALCATNSVELVVVSRFSGVDGDGRPIPRAAGVVTDVIGFTTFDTVLDSQRRRLPGRGT